MTRSLRIVAQGALASGILALVALYFRNEFIANWDQVKQADLSPRYAILAASLGFLALSYLVNTHAWRRAVNYFAKERQFSFTESLGMVNTTQLTKYLPGKVWGYAMQALLVDRNAFPVSMVLYVNLFLLLSSILIRICVGALYFATFSDLMPSGLSWLLAALSLAGYATFVFLNSAFFKLAIRVFEKAFGKRIEFRAYPIKSILRLQGYSLLSSLFLGLSALACAPGLGLELDSALALGLFAGILFSDTVGFVFFMVPGGFGVRESLLYLILKEAGSGAGALVVPIALRILSMLTDAILGLIGLYYLKKYVRLPKLPGRNSPGADEVREKG